MAGDDSTLVLHFVLFLLSLFFWRGRGGRSFSKKKRSKNVSFSGPPRIFFYFELLSGSGRKKKRKDNEKDAVTSHFRGLTKLGDVLLGFYLVLLGFTGFYLVLLGFTNFYWDLPSFT